MTLHLHPLPADGLGRVSTVTQGVKTPIGKIYCPVDHDKSGRVVGVAFSQPSSEPLEILDALAATVTSIIGGSDARD